MTEQLTYCEMQRPQKMLEIAINKLRFQTDLSLKKIKDFNLHERNKKPSGESYCQSFELRR